MAETTKPIRKANNGLGKKIANYAGILLGIFLIALASILTFKACTKQDNKDKEYENPTSQLQMPVDTTKVVDTCTELRRQNQRLQEALDKCNGVKKPLTIDERLRIAEEKLAKMKPSRNRVIYRSGRVRPDVTEKKFNGGFNTVATTTTTFSPPVERKSSTEISQNSENNSLPMTEYMGLAGGKFYTTVTPDGYLLYVVSDPLIKVAPRLNGEAGPEFTYDKGLASWYYADYSRRVTVSDLSIFIEWNVYVGQTNYGTGSYPTYLPHESLKETILRARGRLDGEISTDDLSKMRSLNGNIWTPNAEGSLRPFSFSETGGHAYGKEDKKIYVGWNFRTKILVRKKTTSYIPKLNSAQLFNYRKYEIAC